MDKLKQQTRQDFCQSHKTEERQEVAPSFNANNTHPAMSEFEAATYQVKQSTKQHLAVLYLTEAMRDCIPNVFEGATEYITYSMKCTP